MTPGAWTYPSELAAALLTFGLKPLPHSPPAFVRECLDDLYRYEIRRLRARLLSGDIAKPDYIGHVIALRKKYWPLSLNAARWEVLCREPKSFSP